jgi:predicted transcriptional regulator
MPVTTLKLSEDLKRRVAAVVEGTGKSAHAFMLEAIDAQTTQAEKRRDFVEQALAAERDTLKSGRGYLAADIDTYFDAKIAGAKTARPKTKKWRK